MTPILTSSAACGGLDRADVAAHHAGDEPAADLAMIVALASSFRDKPVPGDLAAIGEVGLTGELRSVNALGQRLSEVRRLGFTKCLIPARTGGKLDAPDGLQLIPVRNIREALAALL